jgi:hypothetical protein
MNKLHYYYSRWTFDVAPDGLDGRGPFHDTYVSPRTFDEMISDCSGFGLAELFLKEFSDETEMQSYWLAANPKDSPNKFPT